MTYVACSGSGLLEVFAMRTTTPVREFHMFTIKEILFSILYCFNACRNTTLPPLATFVDGHPCSTRPYTRISPRPSTACRPYELSGSARGSSVTTRTRWDHDMLCYWLGTAENINRFASVSSSPHVIFYLSSSSSPTLNAISPKTTIFRRANYRYTFFAARNVTTNTT